MNLSTSSSCRQYGWFLAQPKSVQTCTLCGIRWYSCRQLVHSPQPLGAGLPLTVDAVTLPWLFARQGTEAGRWKTQIGLLSPQNPNTVAVRP